MPFNILDQMRKYNAILVNALSSCKEEICSDSFKP